MAVKFEGYFSVLFVRDPERARLFYQEVLGAELKGRDESGAVLQFGPDSLVLLSPDGADDLLSAADVDHSSARTARTVLVAPVDDVDAVYRELTAKGVEFIRPPEDRSWGLRCAHFKDPDGHVWEIHTPLSEQP